MIRKHPGIHQSGPLQGKLKKGYYYNGQRGGDGKSLIVSVRKQKGGKICFTSKCKRKRQEKKDDVAAIAARRRLEDSMRKTKIQLEQFESRRRKGSKTRK